MNNTYTHTKYFHVDFSTYKFDHDVLANFAY